MLSNCFYVIMTRRMAATETSESLILYAALTPVVLLAPTLPFSVSLPQDAWHWLILLSLGFYGGARPLVPDPRLPASATALTALAPYPYLQMVWVIGFGWLIFDQLPDSVDPRRRRDHQSPADSTSSTASTACRLQNSAAPNAEDEELAKKL